MQQMGRWIETGFMPLKPAPSRVAAVLRSKLSLARLEAVASVRLGCASSPKSKLIAGARGLAIGEIYFYDLLALHLPALLV